MKYYLAVKCQHGYVVYQYDTAFGRALVEAQWRRDGWRCIRVEARDRDEAQRILDIELGTGVAAREYRGALA